MVTLDGEGRLATWDAGRLRQIGETVGVRLPFDYVARYHFVVSYVQISCFLCVYTLTGRIAVIAAVCAPSHSHPCTERIRVPSYRRQTVARHQRWIDGALSPTARNAIRGINTVHCATSALIDHLFLLICDRMCIIGKSSRGDRVWIDDITDITLQHRDIDSV